MRYSSFPLPMVRLHACLLVGALFLLTCGDPPIDPDAAQPATDASHVDLGSTDHQQRTDLDFGDQTSPTDRSMADDAGSADLAHDAAASDLALTADVSTALDSQGASDRVTAADLIAQSDADSAPDVLLDARFEDQSLAPDLPAIQDATVSDLASTPDSPLVDSILVIDASLADQAIKDSTLDAGTTDRNVTDVAIGTDAGGPTPYTLVLPSHFPPMPQSANNPLTFEGIELGRKLYHDPRLSQGGPQDGKACATCHLQALSFSSPQPGTSVMAHVNLGFASVFLWAGKVQGDLEDIMMFEVAEFFQTDVGVLQASADYPALFTAAFGSPTIDHMHVARALAQWQRRLTSSNSRYDQYKRQEIALSSQELAGMMTFFSTGRCGQCHVDPLFSDDLMHNNGLDATHTGLNQGHFLVTNQPQDMGVFKTPTLRNIELTTPYMHDGRFTTLEEVVSHYDLGVQTSTTLSAIMQNPQQLNLSAQQKSDLVAFLKTLTDTSYINDPELSAP